MSVRKNTASLTATEKARFTAAVRQVKRYMTSWECACLLALLGFLAVVPDSARAEVCTMYQKYVKKFGAGTPCANQKTFIEVAARNGAGSYYARKVPKCDSNGTDVGCTDFVKSLDGTRAFYHIDPNPNSNDWVFFFDGGGACGAMPVGFNAARACFAGDEATLGFDGYDKHIDDAFEMTTRHASGLYTVPNQKAKDGILSTNAANQYASWNRVWFNKSSFDRFMGNKTNIQPYDGDDILLFFHGRRIIQSVIKELANVSFSVGGEPVPDLSDAEHVLFIGESGGGGGIIHNAEWIKNRIAEVSTSIKASFATASRMLPWIEAEAYFGTPVAGDIWDGRFSGTSEVEKNPAGSGVYVDITYSEGTFKLDGDIRKLLDSWGDINNTTALFLDDDCKNHHSDDAHNQWKCYDEGHVALYHMDENVFFFESLLDGTHAGAGSPVLWMDEVDGAALFPGFVWNSGSTANFTQARINRVLYTIDSILHNTDHRGTRGFYAPLVNAHTMVKEESFYTRKLYKDTLDSSFGDFLYSWQILNDDFLEVDFAAVDDTDPNAYKITWSSAIVPEFGGGWTPVP